MLRHSKAVHLLQAGVNLIYIRDFLGQTDIQTTEIYARADTELKRKVLENAYQDLLDPNLPGAATPIPGPALSLADIRNPWLGLRRILFHRVGNTPNERLVTWWCWATHICRTKSIDGQWV